MNNIDRPTAQRQERFQRLVAKRKESHPTESYEASFNAVMCSEGELVAEMHLANQEAVPVFGPQTAAIVGLHYPKDKAIFRETWLRKEGPIGAAGPVPPYPSESDERRQTAKAAGRITDEPKLKSEAKVSFLAEVDRLQKAGHSYDDSWRIASSTEPGKSFAAQWRAGNAQLKTGASITTGNSAMKVRQQKFQRLLADREEEFPNEEFDVRFAAVCNSDAGRSLVEMMETPSDPTERFDQKALDDAQSKFDALEALLLHEPGWQGKGPSARSGYLQTTHREGRALYATILRQKALKAKEEAVKKVKLASPGLS